MVAKRNTTALESDAIALLKADHAKVKKMFKEFEQLHDDEEDEQADDLAKQICNELKIHTRIEEEIFYPAVRAAINDEDMLDEAEVEHASAKDLIAQIESERASDNKHAAKVKGLGEYIDHHVQEEHTEMFPKARKAKLDMQKLGKQMLARKQQLAAEMGIKEDPPTQSAKRGATARRAA